MLWVTLYVVWRLIKVGPLSIIAKIYKIPRYNTAKQIVNYYIRIRMHKLSKDNKEEIFKGQIRQKLSKIVLYYNE